MLTNINQDVLHLLIVSIFYILTWYPVLNLKQFVSDDIEGLAKFSDRWNDKEQKAIDSYKVGDKEYKNTQFNPTIPFPGSVIRWLRLNIGKRHQIIGRNKKTHDVWGWVQNPFRHHFVSFMIQFANVLLTYLFISNEFGPNMGLMTALLFMAHPVSCQTVAWCSGIGYILSYLGTISTLTLVSFFHPTYVTFLGIIAGNVLSNLALLVGFMNWAPLLVLGYHQEAMVSFAVGIASILVFGNIVVNYRKDQFKKQEMGSSTQFSPIRLILVFKTFFYYILMIIFPNRLGLFHEWGYHYDEPMKKLDKYFWLGLLSVLAMGFWFFHADTQIRLGIVWYVSFMLLFSNIITAQQFVADRYIFVPSLGYALIVSSLLSGAPAIFALILGMYICRSRSHIKTFNSEEEFYLSNCWNFPKSEVALSNLGVTYGHKGKLGSAVDIWIEASRLNPHYAVPNYNLYSAFKQAGDLLRARDHLVKCLNGKIVNFRDLWEKDLKELDKRIEEAKKREIQLRNPSKGPGGPPDPGPGKVNPKPGLPAGSS